MQVVCAWLRVYIPNRESPRPLQLGEDYSKGSSHHLAGLMNFPQTDSCDVAIIGGALSGAAAAILLLRERPQLKVLILEKSESFGRRVGEATVEVSGYF